MTGSSTVPRQRKPVRKAIAATVFVFLGRGLVAAARWDKRVKREIATWPECATITITIAPHGPSVSWRVSEGRLEYLGVWRDVESTLLVTFKSVDVALPVLIGRKGMLQAFAEHRSTLAGDIGFGMSLVRCLHIVEGYLFPDLIGKKVLPSKPVREVPRLLVYTTLPLGSVDLPVGAAASPATATDLGGTQ